jgi:hypothetical protein
MNLNEEDFIRIIGTHPKDIWHILDTREIIMINTLLLNTIQLKDINSQGILLLNLALTANNFNALIRLSKITPSRMIKVATVISNNLLILGHNNCYFNICLEVLIYSKEQYFTRFIITDTISLKTYTKIFTGMVYKPSSNSLEEIKKELETLLPFIKNTNIPVNKSVKDKVLKIAYKILHKTETQFNIFEPIETLFKD